MLQNRRRHLPPPWASLRLGARLDLRLVMPPSLCGCELGAVSQHRMHDDREATGERTDDSAVSSHDANLRFRHRHVQPGKILHCWLSSSMTEPILSASKSLAQA